MSKHTPGPWTPEYSDSMVGDESAWLIVAHHEHDVAEITSPADKAEANARLIAAAPAMFDLLQDITEKIWDDHTINGADAGKIDKLLEQITGETP